MTKIDRFNNLAVTSIQTEIEKAIATIADDYGISLKIKFREGTPLNIEFKIIGAVKNANGEVVSQGKTDWLRGASRYGLDLDWFGKTFWMKNTQYRITGLNHNAPKFCIQAERVRDAKQFRIPARDVINSFAKMTAGLASAA